MPNPGILQRVSLPFDDVMDDFWDRDRMHAAMMSIGKAFCHYCHTGLNASERRMKPALFCQTCLAIFHTFISVGESIGPICGCEPVRLWLRQQGETWD